eukprot:6049383-Alexandrium_andersonii.AAC.1
MSASLVGSEMCIRDSHICTMIVIMVICRYRHHAMVLTITMVMVGSTKSALTRPPELSRSAFCVIVRAEREYDNENLAGARLGLDLD